MKSAVERLAYSQENPSGNPSRFPGGDGFRKEPFADDKALSPQYSECLSLLADILSMSPQKHQVLACAHQGR